MSDVPDQSGSLGELDAAIGAVSSHLGDFDDALTALRAIFDGLGSEWSAPSEQSAADLQSAVSTRSQTLSNRLHEVLQKLRATRANYAATLETNQQMWSGRT